MHNSTSFQGLPSSPNHVLVLDGGSWVSCCYLAWFFARILWYVKPLATSFTIHKTPCYIYIYNDTHWVSWEKYKWNGHFAPKSGGTNMLGSMPSKEILAGFYVNEFQRNKEMGNSPNSYYLWYFTMKVVLVHLSKLHWRTLSPPKRLITIVVQ